VVNINQINLYKYKYTTTPATLFFLSMKKKTEYKDTISYFNYMRATKNL